jgi:sulfite exporter TauE/SafE
MRFFRWNSFTIIGLILIAVGVYGFIRGAGFQFDAGLPNEPREGLYYILVGILMMLNGYIVPGTVSEPASSETQAGESIDKTSRSAQPAAPVRTK